MEQSYASENREKLLAQLYDNSMVFLQSGHVIDFADGCEYEFEVNRDFYYLTGINKKDLYLAIVKKQTGSETILFIPRVSEHEEKWIGKNLRKEKARELSGISTILYLDEMDDYVFSQVDAGLVENIYMLCENVQKGLAQTQNNLLREDFVKRFPACSFFSLEAVLHPLRFVKSEQEVLQIKNAVNIASSALSCVCKNLMTRSTENDVQADFEYIVKRRNSRVSFASIVASGENATCLHYRENCAALEKDGLVLLDVGAISELYCSDITRTYPVSGTFSERQKQLYAIVLEANKRVIEAIRPGVMLRSLNQVVLDFYREKLVEIGLCQTAEEVSNYYYHGVSHMLGLNVHDVSDYDVELTEGMVITVEPGIYVAEEKIGIRIEDDVLVTAFGCKVLSDNIPKEIADIERLIQRK